MAIHRTFHDALNEFMGDDAHLAEAFGAHLPILNPTTPLLPSVNVLHPRLVEEVRAFLRAGEVSQGPDHPLPDKADLVEFVVVEQLRQYVEESPGDRSRLYVLEFQGPGSWQYVKFGHTTNILRRVVMHQRSAGPHGFVLVDGWVSPGVANAQPLEKRALLFGGMVGGREHRQERFYGMPFEVALSVARGVFEQFSHLEVCSVPAPREHVVEAESEMAS